MNGKMRMRRLGVVASWLMTGMLLCNVAQAQTRAWLDRNTLGEGESVTLNIESGQIGSAPDYAPLQADFTLSAQTSSRQVQLNNGSATAKALFGVVLTPRRSGALEIPALRVGAEQTRPLSLQVSAGVADAGSARADARAFIETEIDDLQPYVQQSVGVVVRLYYASQLASGELVLDTPATASLQRVGEDRALVREVNGRRYNVVERRFLLVPERSGPLQLPGARFNGRGVGGLFDDFFGRGDSPLSAQAAARTLQVRAQPDGAPQPWLPLQDLRLRYIAAPQNATVGQALTISLEVTALGATRAQFPELPLPSLGAAAQVFAEPPQYQESFAGGSPQLKLTRRYSIVPQQTGSLTLKGISIPWWDVAHAQARIASVPDLALSVAGDGNAPAPLQVNDEPAVAAGGDVATDAVAVAGVAGAGAWPWKGMAIGFAGLWLLTLAWVLLRRRRAPSPASLPAPGTPVHAPPRYVAAELRKAIDAEGVEQVTRILCAMAGVTDVDALANRLDDAQQREAVLQMQRARWYGEGDIASARTALREAFRKPPYWKPVAMAEKAELDPLYPTRN